MNPTDADRPAGINELDDIKVVDAVDAIDADGGGEVTLSSGGPGDVGRLVGHSVTTLQIRTRYGIPAHLGEIMVVDDTALRVPYFLRVFDLIYGAEAAGDDWFERTAGSMLALDGADQPYQFHDKERRLFNVAHCAVLGYLDDQGRLRKAKTLPDHFSAARRATPGDLTFLSRAAGQIPVGRLRSGERSLELPVGLRDEAFPYHLGVFATTGMGKSNLMKVLAGSVLSTGSAGLLIFDPHGEYYDGGGPPDHRGLIHHPRAEDRLVVYSARELSGPYNRIRLSAREIEVGDLLNLYNFTGPQVEFLRAARARWSTDWFNHLMQSEATELMAQFNGQFFEGTIGVIQRRLQYLSQFGLITQDPKISITANILAALREAKVVLVDTSNMYETEELLVSTVLARALFTAHKEAYGEPAAFAKLPRVLITMEEAQRVLGGGGSLGGARPTIFSQIAREGRKFNCGLAAISQQPKLIPSEVLSQFNTFFVLGLADKRDRETLRDASKQDISQLDKEVQTLMPGETLITSPFTPFALPVQIYLYEEYLEDLRGQGNPGDEEALVGAAASEDAKSGQVPAKEETRQPRLDEGFY